MKKYLFFLAAAAALVACSKNEVIPAVNDAETEITYTVAPKVKSGELEFGTNLNFNSTAFYLANGLWATEKANSSVYFQDLLIDHTTGARRNSARKYYWPKTGSLSFFAWTAVNDAVSSTDGTSTYTPATITSNGTSAFAETVTNTEGVKFTNYDVASNKNVDLLVANEKVDQHSNNAADKIFTEGVATIFKHKLSKVLFTVVTDKEYADNGVTFKVNSITFKSIDNMGDYYQYNTTDAEEEWKNQGNAADVIYYSDATTGFEVPVTTAKTIWADGNNYIYMPQTFTEDAGAAATPSDCFVVDYTITIKNAAGTATISTENVKQTISLNSATAGNVIFPAWEMGKKYTINLKFTLDEILWDPAVEDWELKNSGDVTVNPTV